MTGCAAMSRYCCRYFPHGTSGQIDAYDESTGTGWLTILQKTKPISDPQKLFTAVRDADAANKISWFALAPLNDTYALVPS